MDAIMRQQFVNPGIQRHIGGSPIKSGTLLIIGVDFFESINKQCYIGSFHQGLIDLIKLIIGKIFSWPRDHQTIEAIGNGLIFQVDRFQTVSF